MKDFVYAPDGTYSRFSKKIEAYLNNLRMMNINLMMAFYGMPKYFAEALHDFVLDGYKDREDGSFFAMDMHFNAEAGHPLISLLSCKDPFLPLTRDNIDISQRPFMSAEDHMRRLQQMDQELYK